MAKTAISALHHPAPSYAITGPASHAAANRCVSGSNAYPGIRNVVFKLSAGPLAIAEVREISAEWPRRSSVDTTPCQDLVQVRRRRGLGPA